MSDVRPFEEYKEMIKDMRKEEMIKGLYDLSKNITEKGKEIERLNNIIDELEKWIKENDLGKYRTENVIDTDELLNKLQELKGSNEK